MIKMNRVEEMYENVQKGQGDERKKIERGKNRFKSNKKE